VFAGPDGSSERNIGMTGMEWVLSFILISFYITCLFTVCALTFQKGHTVLGIIGIFFPFLWLIGAFLPAKEGSRYDIDQRSAYSRQYQEYTQ
jgi:hypothetical protein